MVWEGGIFAFKGLLEMKCQTEKARNGTDTVVWGTRKNFKAGVSYNKGERNERTNEALAHRGTERGGGSEAHNFEFCETYAVLLN
jgi:hypothetical protein